MLLCSFLFVSNAHSTDDCVNFSGSWVWWSTNAPNTTWDITQDGCKSLHIKSTTILSDGKVDKRDWDFTADGNSAVRVGDQRRVFVSNYTLTNTEFSFVETFFLDGKKTATHTYSWKMKDGAIDGELRDRDGNGNLTGFSRGGYHFIRKTK